MKKLGIKRETKSNWERRTPLNPNVVMDLVEKGFEVRVESSDIRIYKDSEYEKAGAKIVDKVTDCDFIIGVKEIAIDEIVADKPHLFFSHTIKGQEYNMPLLQKILDSNVTLLDYEKITDDNGRRLVFFGKYAGLAGMVDTLYGAGQRLKQQYGLETPFLHIKQAYQYDSVEDAKIHIRKAGKEIKEIGLPQGLAPFHIFLLGYGNVANGCKEILANLPIEEISPGEIVDLQKNYDNKKIYLTVFKEVDIAERIDGSKFDLNHYFHNGKAYRSIIEQYLPYASIYMNAIYWTPDYPVFLKKSVLASMQGEKQKLIIIGDISCDIEGSVQATLKATEPDNPIYIYDAKTGQITDGFIGKGFADCSVDHFPCEFARESSDAFSDTLKVFMEDMLNNDFSKPIKDSQLPAPIKRCCIAHQGKLEPEFKYLEEYLPKLKEEN